jgi:trigger factor
LKTKVDRINPTRVKLNIEVTPEEFKPSLDHAYEHIAEQVNVPGFRKGKIPAAILDQRVGRPAILAHAINVFTKKPWKKPSFAHSVSQRLM